MFRFSRFKPKLFSSIFGASKPDGSQRLITDASNSNKQFVDAPDVNLPDSGILAELHMRENAKLAIAKSDLHNF